MPPGYWDHHVHFVSTVAAGLSVDLTAAASIGELCAILGKGRTGWVRAWGYDESLLDEGRHPTREDLDRVNRSQPIVVHHRTGHVAVLNSAALGHVGEPDHPDGVLYDCHDLLSRVPRLDPASMAAAATSVSRAWAGRGVVGFTDATHTNGVHDLELLDSWSLPQQITAMVSLAAVGDLPGYGSRVGSVRIGHVKLMPGPHLAGEIASAHAVGYPVGVHVVDVAELESVLTAFQESPPPEGLRDRIEHNALCLPEQVARIAVTGAAVVVNPSFLLHRAAKYRKELAEVEHEWLVRIASLVSAGITVRAGSDSPVAPCRPDEMIAAATDHLFNPAESVDLTTAEDMLAPPEAEIEPPGVPATTAPPGTSRS